MTKHALEAIARGLAPILHQFSLRLKAVEQKERGLDGKEGPMGPRGPEGPPGRDGRDGLSVPGPQGEKGLNGIDGKDGRDGLGFEDLSVLHDGERGITFRFIKGDQIREFKVSVPALIYRGVYAQGKTYEKGDMVTWGGSVWHCEKVTVTKPEDRSGDWKLAVKQGRDGKDGKDGAPPVPPVVKIR